MKNYIKPIIEEELIETEDIIMASTESTGEVDATKGVSITDLFA